MKYFFPTLFFFQLALFSARAFGADASQSASSSMFKMLLGLAVVLLVLAAISWAVKKWMPGVGQQQSIVRVVGGTSVGTRERVVVLEVAGRWLVVGVAGGQMTALANLEPTETSVTQPTHTERMPAKKFADWLKNAKTQFDNK